MPRAVVELLFCLWARTACYHRGGKWIPKFIKVWYRTISVWRSASWGLVEVGWCSRTLSLNVEVNLLQNYFKLRKSAGWSGSARTPELNLIDVVEWPQTNWISYNMAELKQVCKEEWLKSPPEHCAGQTSATGSTCLRLLLSKEVWKV